ncbi:VWA domain-containing protein [Arthrobacter sp. NPDC057013]|uniref:VWA domain-containing protein n=1 Tax=Arthrobacter sp. NPDC057013 TaxID=3345999 RepID=UPI00362C5D1A
MNRLHRLVGLLCIASLFLTVNAPAGAATQVPAPPAQSTPGNSPAQFRPGSSDVLILLDTSGSMADKDSKGVVKIGAAKTAILQQVQEVPPTARLGLMTYPAGSANGSSQCPSAKLRLPVSTSSISEMGAALAALPKPDAGTPTSDAMLDAADYLKSEGLTDVTIVLVSDGESNCGDSPCETAKKLKAENVNVTVNTVGFDISTSGQSELECVAAASGGVYVTAQDSAQLTQVLKEQLGKGLSVSVVAPAEPVPMYEETFAVGVTVSVAKGHRASNVQLQVRDTDASSGSSVKRPIMMLGNMGSNASIPTKWLVRPPTNPKLDHSTFRVTVTADGLTAEKKEFQVTYRHDLPAGANLNGSLKDFKNVLVLGDSYSSGEGAGTADRPYFQTAEQASACHRTKNQYANWLYSPEQVRILACSGAVSRNIYASGQNGEASQLAQVKDILKTGYRPDAIFLSITGNDIHFADIANKCAMSALLAAPTAPVSGGDPLASCPASPKSGAAYVEIRGLVDSVPEYVANVLDHTSQVFAESRLQVPPIIVLKYPQLLARDADSPLRCNGTHRFQTGTLSAAFRDFSTLQALLNNAVEVGVASSTRKGIPAYIASIERAIPASHNMCSADPWFVPVTLAGAYKHSPEMLHPNAAGHQAMAAALNSWASSAGAVKGSMVNSESVPAWQSATVQWWPTESEIDVPLDQPNTIRQPQVDAYGRTVITVTGGDPFTGTTIYVKSKPIVLGHVELDENGRGSLTVDLQATDLPPGHHTINVLGTAKGGKPVVGTVAISIPQPFPLALWIFGVAAILLGLAAWRMLAGARARPLAATGS